MRVEPVATLSPVSDVASDMVRVTTIFVSGSTSWPPVGVFSENVPTATSLAAIVDRALLNMNGLLNVSPTQSARAFESVEAAAAHCNMEPAAFVSVLSEWIDVMVDNLGQLLLVGVKHDIGVQHDVGMVDVDVAEDMVSDALHMGDQRVQAAELLIEQLKCELQSTQAHLDGADERERARIDSARRVWAASEQATRQVLELLLAAEAAAVDAANERAARADQRAANLERELASMRASRGRGGGRGGRGARSAESPAPAAPPPPPPPPPAPPPPPGPPPDLIALILAVPIMDEGRMTADEALAILNVTDKRPVWLLAQVHPDKHQTRQDDAVAATARVNLARQVRGGRVSEMSYDT